MPERSRKKQGPKDPNESAHRIVREATGDAHVPDSEPKNPAAVELGRLGGLKGGRARAEKLSKAERSEIARKAAKARWAKKSD
jgi:hypothetical protein